LGALTELLQDYKNQMTLVELDRSFANYWIEKGFQVRHEDALKLDWSDLIGKGSGLISNLPYQISSSLVIDRSIDLNPLDFMVLMFQKEVAQRLQAKPKSEDYGLLTVIAQVFWDVEFLMEVGPKDFYPPPSIASRVLVFKNKNIKIENPKKFLMFVKEAFKQRRKLMVSNIGGIVDKEKSKAALVQMGFSEMARSEELSPQDFVKLYHDIFVADRK
jgi:16S rRNA (adenine1518-N6/adenine1519-N6)-dimethyltransferase